MHLQSKLFIDALLVGSTLARFPAAIVRIMLAGASRAWSAHPQCFLAFANKLPCGVGSYS